MNLYLQHLRDVFFFRSLSGSDIQQIQTVCKEEKFESGQIVFTEGTAADKFYIVLQGLVEIWKDYHNQDRELLAVDGPGQMFGEMALIDDLPRSATVIAKEPSRLLSISRDDFNRIMRENSSIAFSIMKSVSSIIRKSNEKFTDSLRERNRELEIACQKLKKAQDELLRAERLSTIGRFSSLILHDIRNPLSALQLYAEMILLDPDNKSQITANSKKIIHGAECLNRLANDLLDYSRGEIKLNLSEVNLKEFISRFVQSNIETFGGRNISVQSEVLFEGPVILDVERMFRVLTNLATNAYKAMPDGGVFSICVRKMERPLVLEVADTGVGMTEEIQIKIFDPFFSASDDGGTGLGMCIVKNIVESHGCKMSIESMVNCGTKIKIDLSNAIP